MKIFRNAKGQSLVELLVAIAVAAVMIPAILVGFVSSREGQAQQSQRLLAVPLLKEAEEAVRSVREKGWSNIATNGTYNPIVSGGTWGLATGSASTNGYTRSIAISDVSPLDPSIKKIVATVSWNTPFASSVSSTTYLSRYISNAEFIQTTQADFNVGSKSGVTVTNTSGGEVVLGAGGSADWCNPNASIIAQLDLPKSGIANAISAYEGKAIAGTGENASGVSLASINISNTNPPVPTIAGTFDGYKTNDVYLDNNYGYIATDTNAKEVIIVDLISHQEVGYFNTPRIDDARSIYVLGNRGYVTAGNYLYIFDLTSKTGSRPQVGNDLFFLGSATSVVVKGNYAYVSLASSIIEMQIIDISNPQSWQNTGWANVNGTDGKRVFVNQSNTRAYLATSADESKREFFIIDISQKTGARPTVGSYEANTMNPTSLSIVPGNKALLVGSGGEEYQVIDIANEANPVRCGGLQINTGIRGVVGVLESDSDAYSYIVTGDVSSEFKVIEGGPGGSFATSGTFESSTFDATTSAGFNRFVVNGNKPSQTTMTFQVAAVDANPGTGNCTGATFSFVGPDGTVGTFFATSSAIPVSIGGNFRNPARCFRYKAFLETSDPSQSPALYDMTVNYSP